MKAWQVVVAALWAVAGWGQTRAVTLLVTEQGTLVRAPADGLAQALDAAARTLDGLKGRGGGGRKGRQVWLAASEALERVQAMRGHLGMLPSRGTQVTGVPGQPNQVLSASSRDLVVVRRSVLEAEVQAAERVLEATVPFTRDDPQLWGRLKASRDAFTALHVLVGAEPLAPPLPPGRPARPPPPAPPPPGPVAAETFESLQTALAAEPRAAGKLRIFEQATSSMRLSVGQLQQVLAHFPHSDVARLKALQLGAPRLVDRQNSFQLFSAFPSSRDQEAAKQVLSSPRPYPLEFPPLSPEELKALLGALDRAWSQPLPVLEQEATRHWFRMEDAAAVLKKHFTMNREQRFQALRVLKARVVDYENTAPMLALFDWPADVRTTAEQILNE